ncbi:hypothetical protein Tco_1183635 [Tanacetum coccineum]
MNECMANMNCGSVVLEPVVLELGSDGACGVFSPVVLELCGLEAVVIEPVVLSGGTDQWKLNLLTRARIVQFEIKGTDIDGYTNCSETGPVVSQNGGA